MADILVVEDEVYIAELICRNLELVGHRCVAVHDGEKGARLIRDGVFDLILLDIMLPYMSGFELLELVNQTPVIFVTAKEALHDKLKGLHSGAQDYIVKPFEILELVARVNVVLKRNSKGRNCFTYEDVEIDFDMRSAKKAGKVIDLAFQEFELLEVFVINRNIALSREKLLELAWTIDYQGDIRTVDVHVQRLRRKLGWEEIIKTVYKLGYRLEVGS